VGKEVSLNRIYKPGETCPRSGQYAIVDAGGNPVGPDRTMVREARFPPTLQPGQGYLLINPTQHGTAAVASGTEDKEESDMKEESTQDAPRKHSGQVYALVVYYLIVLVFSFWFLFDTWSSNLTLMRWIGVRGEALEDPLLRTIGFTIVGGLMGTVLYMIRQLFTYYAKRNDYDPRWLGKYITGPWEGAGMAMVVLALIRGGVAVFGGSMGTDVTGASNFAAFGTGALVGFGMREVVGWLEGLVETMFTAGESKGANGSAQDGETETGE
jgi:hypothetical protein